VKKQYAFIISSLLVSLFIYVFYRTEKTVVNELLIRSTSFDTYAALKEEIIRFLPLPAFVIYSLPEGLWVFCITLTSKPYYIQQEKLRIQGVIIPLLFCMGLEIFQWLHFTNGRFDLNDILVSFVGWLLATVSFNDKVEKQNILAPFNANKMVCLVSYGIVYLSHVLE
jgi:hypothetical protein